MCVPDSYALHDSATTPAALQLRHHLPNNKHRSNFYNCRAGETGGGISMTLERSSAITTSNFQLQNLVFEVRPGGCDGAMRRRAHS